MIFSISSYYILYRENKSEKKNHHIILIYSLYNDIIQLKKRKRDNKRMIEKIKNLFSNRKNERENNINDLFQEIEKINLSLLENNQKMILSYYNNENRK